MVGGGHIKKIGLLFCFFISSGTDTAQRQSAVSGLGVGEGSKAFPLRVTLFGSQEEEICLFSVIFGLELQEALLHYLVTATAALFRVDFPHVAPKNATILCLISVWRWRKRCG